MRFLPCHDLPSKNQIFITLTNASSPLRHRITQVFALSSLLALVFFGYADQVDDLDLWWHLRSGEFIYTTHSIPREDPFAYTTEMPETLRALGINEVDLSNRPSEFSHWSINLNHSWLGQLVFYLAYLGAGLTGIGILKSTLFVLSYWVLYLVMRKGGGGPFASFLTLGLVASIGQDFNYSRPQLFSFVLLPFIIYLLADFKQGGRKILALPVVMVIWANLHGGFILGVMVLALFTGGEVLRFLLGKRWTLKEPQLSASHVRTLCLIALAAVLVSFLNPNGYRIFLFPAAVHQSLFVKFIEEYNRPMLYEYHGYWALLVLVGLASIPRLVRLDLAVLLIVGFFAASSVTAIRAIIFFALGSAGVLARGLSDLASWVKGWMERKSSPGPVALSLARPEVWQLLLGLVFFTLLVKNLLSGPVLAFSTTPERYPAEAAAFIREASLPDRIFNNYDWGGYLLWTLPEHQVFIDGRCVSEVAYFQYLSIVGARQGTNRTSTLWKRLLEAHQVQVIITPAVSGSGSVMPLIDRLYFDPSWEVVFRDGKSLVLLRNTASNKRLIQKYALAKRAIIEEILLECDAGIKRFPATWGYYETAGYIYLNTGQPEKATEKFRIYMSMNPYNQKVAAILRKLDPSSPPVAPMPHP